MQPQRQPQYYFGADLGQVQGQVQGHGQQFVNGYVPNYNVYPNLNVNYSSASFGNLNHEPPPNPDLNPNPNSNPDVFRNAFVDAEDTILPDLPPDLNPFAEFQYDSNILDDDDDFGGFMKAETPPPEASKSKPPKSEPTPTSSLSKKTNDINSVFSNCFDSGEDFLVKHERKLSNAAANASSSSLTSASVSSSSLASASVSSSSLASQKSTSMSGFFENESKNEKHEETKTIDDINVVEIEKKKDMDKFGKEYNKLFDSFVSFRPIEIEMEQKNDSISTVGDERKDENLINMKMEIKNEDEDHRLDLDLDLVKEEQQDKIEKKDAELKKFDWKNVTDYEDIFRDLGPKPIENIKDDNNDNDNDNDNDDWTDFSGPEMSTNNYIVEIPKMKEENENTFLSIKPISPLKSAPATALSTSQYETILSNCLELEDFSIALKVYNHHDSVSKIILERQAFDLAVKDDDRIKLLESRIQSNDVIKFWIDSFGGTAKDKKMSLEKKIDTFLSVCCSDYGCDLDKTKFKIFEYFKHDHLVSLFTDNKYEEVIRLHETGLDLVNILNEKKLNIFIFNSIFWDCWKQVFTFCDSIFTQAFDNFEKAEKFLEKREKIYSSKKWIDYVCQLNQFFLVLMRIGRSAYFFKEKVVEIFGQNHLDYFGLEWIFSEYKKLCGFREKISSNWELIKLTISDYHDLNNISSDKNNPDKNNSEKNMDEVADDVQCMICLNFKKSEPHLKYLRLKEKPAFYHCTCANVWLGLGSNSSNNFPCELSMSSS